MVEFVAGSGIVTVTQSDLDMTRFVFASDDDDAVTVAWPMSSSIPVTDGWETRGGSHMWAAVDASDDLRRGLTSEEFFAWMGEHCPSATFVHRLPPEDDEEEGFCFEFDIPVENEAFQYRMRWTGERQT